MAAETKGSSLLIQEIVFRHDPRHAAAYQATGPTPTPPSPINQSTHNLQPANSYNCMQLAPKTASVVPPEDGRLTPETCRGLRHNKVFLKVKVY
jgi:hypothetical protein